MAGERVVPEQVARDVIHMMESVVTEGSGRKAAVAGYRVAGKTGTAWKASAGGYITNRYVSVFAGLATVVVVNEPSAGGYYGGDVAAPVFADVVGGALRLLAVAPDAPLDAPTVPLPDMAPSTDDLGDLPPLPPPDAAPTTSAERSDGARAGGARR